MATFGVGASASRRNVGPQVNAKSVMGPYGKVYDRGVLVFDPTVNQIEQIQDDTYSSVKPNAVSTVVITTPSSKTRAVYTALKSGMSPATLAWADDVIVDARTITGTVKLGAAAAVASDNVVLTQNGTQIIATFNQPTNMGDQAAFNAAGSIGKVTEVDGETISFTAAVV